jgi:hypothetical protein
VTWIITCGRAAVALLVLMGLAAPSDARQNGPLYAGGTFTVFTQTRSDPQPLGGTTWNGSVFVGGWVSPRLAIEFEPSFGRTFSWEYSYRPGPSFTADVVASRRDTFWAAQARTRVGVVEPVFGLAYMRSKLQRHATITGRPYFDDSRIANGAAGVLGLDAPVKIAPRVYLLPTFRVLVNVASISGSSDLDDPLGSQTSAGRLLFRYGAGARITF